MARELDADQLWCPMGRISIQQGTNQARIEAVQTGAFNRVLTNAPGTLTQGIWTHPSRCLGEGCAWWRWGFFSGLAFVPARYRRGRCGMVASRTPYLAMVANVSLLSMGAYLVLCHFFKL